MIYAIKRKHFSTDKHRHLHERENTVKYSNQLCRHPFCYFGAFCYPGNKMRQKVNKMWCHILQPTDKMRYNRKIDGMYSFHASCNPHLSYKLRTPNWNQIPMWTTNQTQSPRTNTRTSFITFRKVHNNSKSATSSWPDKGTCREIHNVY